MSYPTETLHKEFSGFLEEITPKLEILEKLGEVVIQAADERSASVRAKKTRHEAEIELIDRQIKELIRMRIDRLITGEEFLTQKSLLSERQIALVSARIADRMSADQVRGDLANITAPSLI